MSLTYTQANDAIFAVINGVWTTTVASAVGYTPIMKWPGLVAPSTEPGDVFHGKVTRQTVEDNQSTFCTNVTAENKRRYTNHGILIVLVSCPISVGNSYNKGLDICKLVQNALRGRDASGVWFTNVRIKEMPIKDMFYRLSIIADYQYDDVG